MRLSQYATKMGVSYRTAFRWWKAGKLDAYQLDTGTIIVREPVSTQVPANVALYARVSSADQNEDLERQMQRLKDYAAAKGYRVTRTVSELASGLNDSRPKFLKLLTDASIGYGRRTSKRRAEKIKRCVEHAMQEDLMQEDQ